MKPEHQLAWGSPLKEAHADMTMLVPTMTKIGQLSDPGTSPDSTVKEVLANLRTLAKVIEIDITYFLLHSGQGMAANSLSHIKKNILDNVASLEKVCQSR